MDASFNYRENVMKEQHIETDIIEPVYDRVDLETAFREGLLWFKENLWHKPEEQPEEHTVILFECELLGTRSFYTQNIIFKDDYEKYLIKNYDIKRWCYINDLI